MNLPLRTLAVTFALMGAVVAPENAGAQLTLTETGYTVTDLGSSLGAKGVECGPGGIWGDYIYIADSVGDQLERVDFADVLSYFAFLDPNSFPVGLEWGPGPGSNFGDYMYVGCYGTGTIVRVDPSGTVYPFTTLGAAADLAFDPTGAYGNDLFATSAYSGPIWRVDEFGNAVSFSTVPSLYIGFGPGGAWGTGMYSTSETAVGIVTVDVAGVATNFCTGFTNPEGFDWAYGAGFDGDMFVPDVTTGEVWRVESDGTRTLWATMPSAADVAFCNGSLYLVGFHTGECYKVTPEDPVAVTFSAVDARVAADAVRLTWNVFADEDIDGFVVYREDLEDDGAQPRAASPVLEYNQREFVDTDVRPGAGYRYTVGAMLPDGREIRSSPAAVTMANVALSLDNYPNPFNPTTTIEFALPQPAAVVLGIYDSKGRLVVELENRSHEAGTHTIDWDGRDASGAAVSSGVYFYRLTAGNRTLSRKLVLLK